MSRTATVERLTPITYQYTAHECSSGMAGDRTIRITANGEGVVTLAWLGDAKETPTVSVSMATLGPEAVDLLITTLQLAQHESNNPSF